MTSFVFPSDIAGLTFNGKHGATWKSREMVSAANMASNLPLQKYPQYTWELQYELLRHDVTPSDLAKLAGLHDACAGSYDTFLYTEPAFNSVVTEPFGTGDGSTSAFQLVAICGNVGGDGRAELIQNLNGPPSIYKNGVLQTLITHYALGPTGIVTWVTPPANTVALTWSGSFYYRCKFMSDIFEESEFSSGWHAVRSLQFRSVKL